ncbi:MAG: hypothetical protein WA970_01925 [Gammaproteobacteria bacterium]
MQSIPHPTVIPVVALSVDAIEVTPAPGAMALRDLYEEGLGIPHQTVGPA